MTALLLLPPILGALLLAAHFLRQGDLLVVAAILAVVGLLALRRRWVPLVMRLTLWLGAGVWSLTLLQLAAERLRFGMPWLRMALILGGVAVFSALSTLVFRTRRLRSRYGLGPPGAPAGRG